jgi:hypothetical protein
MTKNNTTNKGAEKLFDAIGKLFGIYFNISYYGIKKFNPNSFKMWFSILFFLLVMFNLTYNYDFLVILNKIMPNIFTVSVLTFFVKVPWVGYFSSFSILGILLSIPLFGLEEYKRIKAYQKDFDFLSIKAGNGSPPKVIRVVEVDDFKTKVILKSEGIGIDRYKTKTNDLTAALGQIVEEIRSCNNPKYIEFSLTKKSLPKQVSYYEIEKEEAKPYSFSIGESLGGYLYQDISTLPHMLIAGTTGGGKSVFFKQTLVSLLKSSNNLQLYLLDLKKGVEMRPFENLPNTKVIKTEKDAVATLKNIRDEMDKRFKYLEKKKLKEIDPVRDKMDKIIIGIDEASVLYTKSKNNSKNKLINEARELTEELSKLSRAAGIHLILATQKVTKETIDTKVQENIGGRVCFRMNTLQGSMTVLGNKMALTLPDIKGRAIWARGNKFTQVQAPFLSEDELEEELSILKNELVSKERKFHGPMISTDVLKTNMDDEITDLEKNDSSGASRSPE